MKAQQKFMNSKDKTVCVVIRYYRLSSSVKFCCMSRLFSVVTPMLISLTCPLRNVNLCIRSVSCLELLQGPKYLQQSQRTAAEATLQKP
jgi:hypothetical protein